MTLAQHDVTVSSGSVTRDIPCDDSGGRELEISALPGDEVTLRWQASLAGAVGCWTTRGGRTKTIAPDWSGAFTASLTAEAPVGLFFDASSSCTHAYAFSETVTDVACAVGISEELNRIVGSLTFTAGEEPTYLRLYGPGRPYEDVLADVAAWWAAADPLGGPGSLPDLAAHVARTKGLGLAEMLWISLPFVGRRSEAGTTYGHLLLPDDGQKARLWDVRLPETRRHVAGIYRRPVEDHGLDGLKIDFIDQWSVYPPTDAPTAADTHDYTVGVDLLLQAVVDELRMVLDAPLVEFRQRYIGPRMMRYGNLFRVADFPGDACSNRVGSIDLRHLVTARAVHADVVMWAPDDPAEDAAEQLLSTAFSVPQISMVLAELSEEHTAMLRHYLSWWSSHRETLLDGRIAEPRPDLGYPVVTSSTASEVISIGYAYDAVVPVGTRPTVIANATGTPTLVLELARSASLGDVRDCRGVDRPDLEVDLPAGLHRITLPRGGTAVLRSR